MKTLQEQVEDILKCYRGNRLDAEEASYEIVMLCGHYFCEHEYIDADVGMTCKKCGEWVEPTSVIEKSPSTQKGG